MIATVAIVIGSAVALCGGYIAAFKWGFKRGKDSGESTAEQRQMKLEHQQMKSEMIEMRRKLEALGH
jgi:hypothetical protein